MLLALGMLVLTRKRVDFGDGWVWPVATVRVAGRTYYPVVTDGWGSKRGAGIHTGVDIMFRRLGASDLVGKFPPGSPDGTPAFFAPPQTPILAARAGRIWSVQKTARGWAVLIDHGKPFASFYTHLESSSLRLHSNGVDVNTGAVTHVRAGQPIGFMGWDPQDAQRVRHLHFEVWHEGTADAAVDVEAAMRTWSRASLVYNVP